MTILKLVYDLGGRLRSVSGHARETSLAPSARQSGGNWEKKMPLAYSPLFYSIPRTLEYYKTYNWYWYWWFHKETLYPCNDVPVISEACGVSLSTVSLEPTTLFVVPVFKRRRRKYLCRRSPKRYCQVERHFLPFSKKDKRMFKFYRSLWFLWEPQKHFPFVMVNTRKWKGSDLPFCLLTPDLKL